MQLQYVAELPGSEMDEFNTLWTQFRDEVGDEEILQDYRRFAVAFCWCDVNRNRFYTTLTKLREVVAALRSVPQIVTTRMFVVANGANAFVGIDDNVKKSLSPQKKKAKKDAGSGDSPSASDSPAEVVG